MIFLDRQLYTICIYCSGTLATLKSPFALLPSLSHRNLLELSTTNNTNKQKSPKTKAGSKKPKRAGDTIFTGIT